MAYLIGRYPERRFALLEALDKEIRQLNRGETGYGLAATIDYRDIIDDTGWCMREPGEHSVSPSALLC